MMKRYSKKDFLDYASAFNYQTDIEEGNFTGYKSDAEFKKEMKKWKIEQFRDFYGFTHKDPINGREVDNRNYKCLDCLTILKPEYISEKNKYYCYDCVNNY
jgi:hypothetical protein